MAGLRPGKTLFEAVPALGAISAHGGGVAKLLPVGFEHPPLELVEGLSRIGRDPGQNQLVIASSHISRSHCEMEVHGVQVWVKDLGSHNGTFVNGERVTQAELHPGDNLGLSRRVTFVLAMDQDLQQPVDMDVDMEGEKTRIEPVSLPDPPPPAPSPPARPSAPQRLSTTPGQGRPVSASAASIADVEQDGEPDAALLLKQAEQQRNVLAILYQISLRCLMADNQKEVEQLLTNVLQRLVPLDSGFILYQVGDSWRASVCPDSRFPPADATVKAFYKLAVEAREALVIEGPSDQLAQLGLQTGSALMVPMMLNESMNGVVGTMAAANGVYTAEIIDIMKQLANVSAAALRDR